jgi:hypothetical protein
VTEKRCFTACVEAIFVLLVNLECFIILNSLYFVIRNFSEKSTYQTTLVINKFLLVLLKSVKECLVLGSDLLDLIMKVKEPEVTFGVSPINVGDTVD